MSVFGFHYHCIVCIGNGQGLLLSSFPVVFYVFFVSFLRRVGRGWWNLFVGGRSLMLTNDKERLPCQLSGSLSIGFAILSPW